MLTVNTAIQDRLINSQRVIIRHIEFAEGSICEVYVKICDEQAGSKTMRSFYLGRQNSWVPFEKCETEISIKKRSPSPFILRTQFSLTLARASTAHKFQGLSLEQDVTEFDLQNQKSIGLGKIHTALSRVQIYDNLYCIGKF